MAEGPKITRNDDGLFVRYEFDAHYISDEDAQRIRGYIDQLQAENSELRELVQDIYGVMWACAGQRCTHRHDGCFRVHGNHGDICVSERCWYEDRMRELGIEV